MFKNDRAGLRESSNSRESGAMTRVSLAVPTLVSLGYRLDGFFQTRRSHERIARAKLKTDNRWKCFQNKCPGKTQPNARRHLNGSGCWQINPTEFGYESHAGLQTSPACYLWHARDDPWRAWRRNRHPSGFGCGSHRVPGNKVEDYLLLAHSTPVQHPSPAAQRANVTSPRQRQLIQ